MRKRLYWFGAAAAAIGIAWTAWILSDRYQIREVRRQGHAIAIEQYAKAPVECKAWFRAAVLTDVDGSIDAANRVPNPQARAEMLSAMADSLAQAGQTRNALSVTAEIRDTGELAAALKSLASTLLPTPATDTDREESARALQEQTSTRNSVRTAVLSAVSKALAWAGWNSAAESTARQVEDPAARAIAAAELALEAARDKDLTRAKWNAEQAAGSASRVVDPIQRATLYAALARAWANSPLWEAARAAAQSAAATAETIPDPGPKASALAAASRALLVSGAKDEALTMADRALLISSLPAVVHARTAALTSLGRIREARLSVDTLVDPLARLEAFTVFLIWLPA